MKIRITFLLLLITSLSTQAQLKDWPKMNELQLIEIRTASNNVLVAYFMGPDPDEITTNFTDWKLNGKSPKNLEKWVTPNWSRVEFGYEHHIYLTMDKPFVEGEKYELKTPFGNKTFTFNSKDIFCESFKTNQSGYSALSKVRFANFAIWTGTGAGQKIEGKLPAYEVYDISSGNVITKGSFE